MFGVWWLVVARIPSSKEIPGDESQWRRDTGALYFGASIPGKMTITTCALRIEFHASRFNPWNPHLLRGHQPRANQNSPPQYFLENFFRDSSSGDVAGAVSDGGAGSAAFSGSLAGAAAGSPTASANALRNAVKLCPRSFSSFGSKLPRVLASSISSWSMNILALSRSRTVLPVSGLGT